MGDDGAEVMTWWTAYMPEAPVTTNWKKIELDLDLAILRAARYKDIIRYRCAQFQRLSLFGKELNIPFTYEWGKPKKGSGNGKDQG